MEGYRCQMSKQTRRSYIKCPNCDHQSVISRKFSRLKGDGHLKNFHCPNCNSLQRHTEISNYDVYSYRKKNEEFSNIKIFKSKRRLEVKINTSASLFRTWNILEADLTTQSIILNSDYNLMENLLLNYIEEGDFREEVNLYYQEKPTIIEEAVIKFNISMAVYERFKLICEEAGLIDTIVIHHILEFIYDNDVELEPLN